MDAMIPTVLDTDPGIDDALALLLAWGSPELDVLALTVVAGNAPLADTARNAARLVAVRRPARPPHIALGAAAPLRRPLVTATPDEHGGDGLGDAPDWPPVASPPASPSAAETLVALARAHAERLTLIALGPLTNLALALGFGPFWPVMIAAIPFAAIHVLSNALLFALVFPILSRWLTRPIHPVVPPPPS